MKPAAVTHQARATPQHVQLDLFDGECRGDEEVEREPAPRAGPLWPFAPGSGAAAAHQGRAEKRKRTGARYHDPDTGETWSGRGLKPKWLRVRLEQGRRLEEFDTEARADTPARPALARAPAWPFDPNNKAAR